MACNLDLHFPSGFDQFDNKLLLGNFHHIGTQILSDFIISLLNYEQSLSFVWCSQVVAYPALLIGFAPDTMCSCFNALDMYQAIKTIILN